MLPTPPRARCWAALALVGLLAAGCATRPESLELPGGTGSASPPAPPAAPSGGPGTYAGVVETSSGGQATVLVTVEEPSGPSDPLEQRIVAFLAEVAATLEQPAPPYSFITVGVDNRGQVETVPLPTEVDLLDQAGIGSTYRPAYAAVGEARALLDETSLLSRRGVALQRELDVRDGLVRPGKLLRVPYLSTDPRQAPVGTVVVNGEQAVKSLPDRSAS